MPKKDQTQTVNVDPSTQAYQDQYLRPGATAAADALRALPQFGPESYLGFMNPYQSQVIDAIRANFDRQRGLARGQGLDEATRAGASRSTRGGVRQAQLEGGVNRDETAALAGLYNQGYNTSNQLALAAGQANQSSLLAPVEALLRGVGATGSQSTQQGDYLGGLIGNIAGIGGIAGGLGFNPFGGGGGGGGGGGYLGFGPAGGFI